MAKFGDLYVIIGLLHKSYSRVCGGRNTVVLVVDASLTALNKIANIDYDIEQKLLKFHEDFYIHKVCLTVFVLLLQVSTLDWVRAEKMYNLCEVLFKVHKVGHQQVTEYIILA